MKAGDRYFMASVDLLTAKGRIERIMQSLDEHKLPPSMELMVACIDDLHGAMLKTHRDRLSDPQFGPMTPGCQAQGCFEDGDYHVCLNHSCDVIPADRDLDR